MAEIEIFEMIKKLPRVGTLETLGPHIIYTWRCPIHGDAQIYHWAITFSTPSPRTLDTTLCHALQMIRHNALAPYAASLKAVNYQIC